MRIYIARGAPIGRYETLREVTTPGPYLGVGCHEATVCADGIFTLEFETAEEVDDMLGMLEEVRRRLPPVHRRTVFRRLK